LEYHIRELENPTTSPSQRRTYGESCGIARALDVVGERWALLVVRELLLGPKRFTDLRAGLRNLGPDVLTQRLRDLETRGVVARRRLDPPAGSMVYELTDWGRGLEPVVLELGRWGTSAPFPPGDPGMSADSAVLALKTVFEPAAAGDLDASYELRFDGQRFRAEVAGGRLALARGAAESPDATIAADIGTLMSVLWRGMDLDEALAAGAMQVEGDRRAAERFLNAFPLPE
jgi:DNA-binding HxlR family transcriptional regulator